MFVYDEIVTIYREDTPLHSFTNYGVIGCGDQKALKWIEENVSPELRDGVYFEIETVELVSQEEMLGWMGNDMFEAQE